MGENIKAVIFDMGGVILRSEDRSSRDELAHSYGMTRLELEAVVFDSDSARIATVGKTTEEEHWQSIFAALNVPTEKQQAFTDAFWRGDRFDRELVQFLRDLRPQYKTGLLSNAWSGARAMLTDTYQCIDAFDVSMFSCEVGLAKPDPAIYSLLLERMQVAPGEAIFLDDFERNILAANALGIHGVQFKSREQAIAEMRQLLFG